MQTVHRNRTVEKVKEKHAHEGKTDNKYRPNYNAIEKNSNKQIKWIPSENEMEFHYEHNDNFKHVVDLKLACEKSSNRENALRKLYFDYKNVNTFKNSDKLHSIMSNKVISKSISKLKKYKS
jgi:hypothetical protein